MLTELRIRNFAIIESLSLPLARGFNVLTGETGAGKSIIVGALGLLLGERASADLIRTGADKAAVEGVFDISERAEIAAFLDEHGIDAEDSLVVLKREVSSAGRTRAWVNGTTVSAAILGEIGRLLVNLHGQHEAQTLLDTGAQLHILDAFAGASDTVGSVRVAHAALAQVRRERADLARRRAEAEKRADYLRHVVQEIDGARVIEGEDVKLEEEAKRLENAGELKELSGSLALSLEGDDESVLSRLGAIDRALAHIKRLDPTLGRLQELHDSAYYALQTFARELDDYQGTVDLDPARLEEVRRRRDLLFRLTKKYGATLDEVLSHGRDARAELELVDSAELDLRALGEREAAAAAELSRLAAELTTARTSAAKRLARAVDEVLPELGMTDGHFLVALDPLADIGAEGAERIEFRVSLNVGHEDRPLARVASGGELSRVMLALKTILARLDRVPTLIFDEVDAGIGGRVGLQVGETLRNVAAYHQVFVITHLPQIAARAHHHMLVSKGAREGVAVTSVAVLDGQERVNEVARMLGGDPESEVSRAHASELLQTASSAPEAKPVRKAAAKPGRRG